MKLLLLHLDQPFFLKGGNIILIPSCCWPQIIDLPSHPAMHYLRRFLGASRLRCCRLGVFLWGHPPAPPSSYALKRHGSHRLLFTPKLTTTHTQPEGHDTTLEKSYLNGGRFRTGPTVLFSGSSFELFVNVGLLASLVSLKLPVIVSRLNSSQL